MKTNRLLFIPLIFFALNSTIVGQSLKPGKNILVIRGQSQDIYYYPAEHDSGTLNHKILFAPGDGGWRGFAITLAQKLASWGYNVYGLDTKQYLESFTGSTKLKESDVMTDFRQIVVWMRKNTPEKINLFGWSEGAGLCLLAAAAKDNKDMLTGLITMGLPEANVLAWKLIDYLTYFTRKNADEPSFKSIEYLPGVTPLPIYMIQSTHDEYVATEVAKRLFAAAKEPKQFLLIEALNHRFEGNQEKFFNTLFKGLQWISKTIR